MYGWRKRVFFPKGFDWWVWDKLKCKLVLERKWDTMPTLKWEMSKHWRMTSNEHMTERNTKLSDIFCNKTDHTKIKVNSSSIFLKMTFIFLLVEPHDCRIFTYTITNLFNLRYYQWNLHTTEKIYLHIFCNYHKKTKREENPSFQNMLFSTL